MISEPLSSIEIYIMTSSVYTEEWKPGNYRKVSNIRRTKSQKLNDSRLVLQLSLPNPLKLGVKLSLKM